MTQLPVRDIDIVMTPPLRIIKLKESKKLEGFVPVISNDKHITGNAVKSSIDEINHSDQNITDIAIIDNNDQIRLLSNNLIRAEDTSPQISEQCINNLSLQQLNIQKIERNSPLKQRLSQINPPQNVPRENRTGLEELARMNQVYENVAHISQTHGLHTSTDIQTLVMLFNLTYDDLVEQIPAANRHDLRNFGNTVESLLNHVQMLIFNIPQAQNIEQILEIISQITVLSPQDQTQFMNVITEIQRTEQIERNRQRLAEDFQAHGQNTMRACVDITCGRSAFNLKQRYGQIDIDAILNEIENAINQHNDIEAQATFNNHALGFSVNSRIQQIARQALLRLRGEVGIQKPSRYPNDMENANAIKKLTIKEVAALVWKTIHDQEFSPSDKDKKDKERGYILNAMCESQREYLIDTDNNVENRQRHDQYGKFHWLIPPNAHGKEACAHGTWNKYIELLEHGYEPLVKIIKAPLVNLNLDIQRESTKYFNSQNAVLKNLVTRSIHGEQLDNNSQTQVDQFYENLKTHVNHLLRPYYVETNIMEDGNFLENVNQVEYMAFD